MASGRVRHYKLCEHEGCQKHPSFGWYLGQVRYCAAHKDPGMRSVKRRGTKLQRAWLRPAPARARRQLGQRAVSVASRPSAVNPAPNIRASSAPAARPAQIIDLSGPQPASDLKTSPVPAAGPLRTTDPSIPQDQLRPTVPHPIQLDCVFGIGGIYLTEVAALRAQTDNFIIQAMLRHQREIRLLSEQLNALTGSV